MPLEAGAAPGPALLQAGPGPGPAQLEAGHVAARRKRAKCAHGTRKDKCKVCGGGGGRGATPMVGEKRVLLNAAVGEGQVSGLTAEDIRALLV